ncbi:PepSY domain-containing protein [Pseudazoarcus pumilus]|jgi:hypothetical protein|uniref:PepSY domain-containing protein n=1 Tax=Pseudazoarcus pumilus TaxID=2067960 RepID=A0A2I6S4G4_9RHOO|nr:PepSY domain-containing protein [Pseudazoarcus pumilus]AUN94154.1 PepSY domain-containing protein [Pseudazoarcus pumilus]
MTKTGILSTLLLTATLATGGALFAGSHAIASDRSATASQSSEWLSIQDVLQRLEAAGYRNFEEVERESDGYEVKATDPDGRRVELDVHPVSGEILKTEVKREKHD